MADGTKVTRMLDASRYPKHYLYLDGNKSDETAFEPGEHWEENQDLNFRFGQWVAESQDQRTPFLTKKGYEKWWNSIFSYGPHPVLDGSKNGDVLTAEQVKSETDIQFPWD